MHRRDTLKTLGGFSLGGMFPWIGKSTPAQSQTSTKKPNIVMFYVDDLGWRDVGFMGSDFYETPHIDRMARQGMIFTQAYANAPNCAPSRACLMSGQYSPRHGVYTVGSPERGESAQRKLIPPPNRTSLPEKHVTLAEMLKKAGYHSAHAGKWHLGSSENSSPETQGFDLNIGGNRAGAPRSYFSPYHNPNLSDGPEGEHLTDRITTESMRFIEDHHEEPFFLYLSFYAVHTPLQGKADLVEKYERKTKGDRHHHPTYAAMIENTDRNIGRVLDQLDRLDLTENTVVIFSSDNGGYGPATTMTPLRGAKGMLYEGGIRVPMAVRYPNRVPTGTRCDTPVIGVDVFPTLMEWAKGSVDSGYPLDGLSLTPLLQQSEEWKRENLYWHFPAYLQAYRKDTGPWRTTPAGAIRSGDYKLIEFFEDGRLELYHLQNDIGENDNLADRLPQKTRELHQQWKLWRQQLKAPVPTALNPGSTPKSK